jgi:hypothetical protein
MPACIQCRVEQEMEPMSHTCATPHAATSRGGPRSSARLHIETCLETLCIGTYEYFEPPEVAMCQLHVADTIQHTFRMPHTISGASSATSHWRRMCIRVGISIPETGTKRAVPADLSSMEDCAGYGNRVGNASLSTTLVSHTYPKRYESECHPPCFTYSDSLCPMDLSRCLPSPDLTVLYWSSCSYRSHFISCDIEMPCNRRYDASSQHYKFPQHYQSRQHYKPRHGLILSSRIPALVVETVRRFNGATSEQNLQSGARQTDRDVHKHITHCKHITSGYVDRSTFCYAARQ